MNKRFLICLAFIVMSCLPIRAQADAISEKVLELTAGKNTRAEKIMVLHKFVRDEIAERPMT